MSEQTDLAALDVDACLPPRKTEGPEYREAYANLARVSFPACPDCGRLMMPRQAKATGNWFWGCAGFPDCKRTKQWDRAAPLTESVAHNDQAISIAHLPNGHVTLSVLADDDIEVWHEADGWHTRH